MEVAWVKSTLEITSLYRQVWANGIEQKYKYMRVFWNFWMATLKSEKKQLIWNLTIFYLINYIWNTILNQPFFFLFLFLFLMLGLENLLFILHLEHVYISNPPQLYLWPMVIIFTISDKAAWSLFYPSHFFQDFNFWTFPTHITVTIQAVVTCTTSFNL